MPCYRRDNMVAIPPSRLGVGVGVVHGNTAAFSQRTLTCRHAALPRTKRVLMERGRQKKWHYKWAHATNYPQMTFWCRRSTTWRWSTETKAHRITGRSCVSRSNESLPVNHTYISYTCITQTFLKSNWWLHFALQLSNSLFQKLTWRSRVSASSIIVLRDLYSFCRRPYGSERRPIRESGALILTHSHVKCSSQKQTASLNSPCWRTRSLLEWYGCEKRSTFLLWRSRALTREDQRTPKTICRSFLHAGKPTATITSVWVEVREADGGS